MTEEEKRRKAMEIFAQEQTRLKNRRAIDTFTTADITTSLARSEQERQLDQRLSQHGITPADMKKAFEENYERGKKDMIQFRMVFFLASTVIAVKELFNTDPDTSLSLLKQIDKAIDELKSRDAVVAECLSVTGVDVSGVDIPAKVKKPNRADRMAVERMRSTGITEKDLEYERTTGYDIGWNSQFFMSACYAAAALALNKEFGTVGDATEEFLARIGEITDEEISVADIVERAKQEVGVDVGQLARE